jgi:prepilin-type processing-associated H-X9-DG protein
MGRPEYVLFGRLYVAGLMKSPEAFYCPAENDPKFQMNTPDNPWPPGPEGPAPTKNVQAGYAMNSSYYIPDDLTGAVDSVPFTMPRLSRFKQDLDDKSGDRRTGRGDWPIVSDLLATESHVRRRHRDGLNVLYSDGSARWQSRSIFIDDSEGGVDQLAKLQATSDANNKTLDRIWELMFEHK